MTERAGSRPERRQLPRVSAAEAGSGQLKATIPVTIHNVSAGGVLLELRSPLRPGMSYTLEARFRSAGFAATVEVTRCRAGAYAENGEGGRSLLYRAGAEFVNLSAEQAHNIAQVLELINRPPGSVQASLQRA